MKQGSNLRDRLLLLTILLLVLAAQLYKAQPQSAPPQLRTVTSMWVEPMPTPEPPVVHDYDTEIDVTPQAAPEPAPAAPLYDWERPHNNFI